MEQIMEQLYLRFLLMLPLFIMHVNTIRLWQEQLLFLI